MPKNSSLSIVDVDPIALRHAYVELNFGHGYPAMPNGMPFWHKMDFEAGFAFAAFQMFLEMGEDGPRELFDLCQNLELLQIAGQQIGREITPIELGFQLQEYFILHYWYVRGRAFDLYKETALRHQRLRKQVKMEDKHYKIADSLLEKPEAIIRRSASALRLSHITHDHLEASSVSLLVDRQRATSRESNTDPLDGNNFGECIHRRFWAHFAHERVRLEVGFELFQEGVSDFIMLILHLDLFPEPLMAQSGLFI